MRRRTGHLPSGCVAIAALVAATLAPVAGAAPPSDTIVVAMTEDIRGVDPRRERDALANDPHRHVVEGLVGFREDLEVAPVLAERWEIRDDGRTYVFTLREGVRFHNGAPLTSAEVKWSWDYLMAEGSLWRCRSSFSGQVGFKVEAVETPDARTVVFRVNRPNGSFLATLARVDCAMTPVLHPVSLNADGSWKAPVGTGPFTIAERKVGQSIELARFPGYVAQSTPHSGMTGRREALVERVRYLVVPDAATRKAALVSGDIDLAALTGDAATDMRKQPNVAVHSAETTSWYGLLLNEGDPTLKDKRVRQGIAAAIDRDAIAAAVNNEQARGTASAMPSFGRYHSALHATGAKPDREKARALLKAGGYAGQPLTMTTNKRYPQMYDMAVLAQGMLEEVGVRINLEVVEWGLQLANYNKGAYQMQAFGYSPRFEPLGHWERIVGPEARKVWKSPEAIAILKRAEASNDPAVVQAGADELFRRFVDEVPMVAVFHVVVDTVANRRLQGIRSSSLGNPYLWNVAIGR
ncbi:MAG: ABC transporter substrate-binding protein [Alphaproteobacteria bacterium]|nr:ABC transporter substrate-binding protein [Alphaproteobacteria bacterium]